MLPTPDSGNDVSSKPTRSSFRRGLRRQAAVSSAATARVFVLGVAVETDSEAEPDLVKGSCAVSTARLEEGSRHSTAQRRPPSAQSQQSIADEYIPQGRGNLFLPALQTSWRIGERVRALRHPLSTFTGGKLPLPHKTGNQCPVPLALFRT